MLKEYVISSKELTYLDHSYTWKLLNRPEQAEQFNSDEIPKIVETAEQWQDKPYKLISLDKIGNIVATLDISGLNSGEVSGLLKRIDIPRYVKSL